MSNTTFHVKVNVQVWAGDLRIEEMANEDFRLAGSLDVVYSMLPGEAVNRIIRNAVHDEWERMEPKAQEPGDTENAATTP